MCLAGRPGRKGRTRAAREPPQQVDSFRIVFTLRTATRIVDIIFITRIVDIIDARINDIIVITTS